VRYDGRGNRIDNFFTELTSWIFMPFLPSFRIARPLPFDWTNERKRYKKKWQSKVTLNSEQSCPEE
jgi:hypothetical protein